MSRRQDAQVRMDPRWFMDIPRAEHVVFEREHSVSFLTRLRAALIRLIAG